MSQPLKNDRHIALASVLNLRDFGGYDAAGGAKIKRGHLFRSAHFAEASVEDVARLDALGVRVVVDLRRPEEREAQPNLWPGESARTIANDDGRAHGLPPHLAVLLDDNVTAQSVADSMRAFYREYPFSKRYVALFRDWFAALQKTDGAALVHCAAGKDRTGVLCALTLHALGVHEDQIVADYELTNVVLDVDARVAAIKPRAEARLDRAIPDDALHAMVCVHRDYLHAAFDAMIAARGSTDAYLREVLGVGAQAREALRARLSV